MAEESGDKGLKRCEVIVIGSGPAGLSCAIEAAGVGADVTLIDENRRPGGQLFKQIHKYCRLVLMY